jgi:glutamate synthase domain-containing protein 3
MTGGKLYVSDPDMLTARVLAETAPPKRRPDAEERAELRMLIESHAEATGSDLAAWILKVWETEQENFWVIEGAPGPSQDLEAGHEGEVDADQLEPSIGS